MPGLWICASSGTGKKAEHAPDKETLDQKKEELQKQNEVTAALSEAAGNFGRQTEAAREELARRIAWRAAAPARTKEAPADQKCQKEQERLAKLSEEQFAQAAKETEKQLASEEKRQKTRREEYAAYENSSSRNRSSGKTETGDGRKTGRDWPAGRRKTDVFCTAGTENRRDLKNCGGRSEGRCRTAADS